MHRKTLLLALAVTLRLVSMGRGALTVNPPRQITHQVSVQVIQTALDDGSSPATMFGDSAREAAIKSAIDTIWAQAGIDIHFLPNVVRYNNTFAYRGLGLGVRPLEDLQAMNADASLQTGILNPNPSVINLFFVNVAPGFDVKPQNWVTGAGHVGAGSIAAFVGSSVSADHAAHWLAHEIGHNLGLLHTQFGTANLMSNTKNSELLSAEQIEAIFQTQGRDDAVASIRSGGTGFPQPIQPQLAGDFDHDGSIDTADYVLWRNSFGKLDSLAADGNGDRVINNGDYLVWRADFGLRTSAAVLDMPKSAHSGSIPEPETCGLLVIGLANFVLSYKFATDR